MSNHPTDTFSVSFAEDGKVYLHRRDNEDATKNPLTLELQKFEVFALLEALLGIPELADRAVGQLESSNIARRVHGL